jgi:FixJ family two-component response regulator
VDAINSGTENSQPTTATIVNVIENDESNRRALVRLLRSAGFASASFCCVDDFLKSDVPQYQACVLTDVHMPGISALELPKRLRERGIDIPVIFLTADYSTATRNRIREAGGRAYFKKPVDDQALIDTIRWTTVKA